MTAGDVRSEAVSVSSEAEHSVPRACLNCGTALTDRRTGAKFCSDRCRTGYNRDHQRNRINELVHRIEALLKTLTMEINGVGPDAH